MDYFNVKVPYFLHYIKYNQHFIEINWKLKKLQIIKFAKKSSFLFINNAE
jgi:hypothetical protein